ncbi:hypothetical protein HX866_03260 [Pseudomonas gingeri]|uniref:hypothetical protein n=1 Tax=Pseudomonas gingeri TaxID=117681 RepID=UPI0015A4C273|nr:hypothetical protein [Pseudomonas gingeri]NWA23901.1 hypothetical protein [Pseudomonas gingeri]
MTQLDSRISLTFRSNLAAITTLMEAGHHTHAIALIYSAIDHMSWLNTTGEPGGRGFKDWVHRFLFNGDTFDFNAEDLWAARCGLLHTGAAESDLYRGGSAKLVYYVLGESLPDEGMLNPVLTAHGIARSQVVIVDYYWLSTGFVDALSRFQDHLLADVAAHTRAAEKAALQMVFQVSSGVSR